MMRRRFIVIVGPTASGKRMWQLGCQGSGLVCDIGGQHTDLRGMDIGTAKATERRNRAFLIT